jgi:hypothetical protein
MGRSKATLVCLMFAIAALMVTGVGCKKKVAPPPPAPVEEPPPQPPKPEIPAPTVSLNVSPAAIEKGKSTTLSWNSTNATGVVIDNGVGTVEPSGRRTVSPSASTTYIATASGPGGRATAEARVTVTEPPPPPPPPISDAEFFNTNIKDAFFGLPSGSRSRDIATNGDRRSTISPWVTDAPMPRKSSLSTRGSTPPGSIRSVMERNAVSAKRKRKSVIS